MFVNLSLGIRLVFWCLVDACSLFIYVSLKNHVYIKKKLKIDLNGFVRRILGKKESKMSFTTKVL